MLNASNGFHRVPHSSRQLPIIFEALEIDKGLIDAVILYYGRKTSNRFDHASAQVAVEGVVGRENTDAIFLHDIANLKQRHAHLHAKCFRFLGSGYSTAIIVGKHNDGDADELLVEDPLATYVKLLQSMRAMGVVISRHPTLVPGFRH